MKGLNPDSRSVRAPLSMRSERRFEAQEMQAMRRWKMSKTPVTAVTEQHCRLGETPDVDMVREAAVNSLSGAGRHEAAVERGSRS